VYSIPGPTLSAGKWNHLIQKVEEFIGKLLFQAGTSQRLVLNFKRLPYYCQNSLAWRFMLNVRMNALRLPGRVFGLALCAVSTLASAQTAAPSNTSEEVVVSASRRDQKSFDAPAAIQTVDAETIRASGPAVNLSEALSRVPGLVVLNRQNYSQDLQLSIRGFGARSSFGIRGVRLMIDGIPATMPDGQGQASTLSLPFTERIEVLRGPMAQLYGNAAGGVVQAFTKTPGAKPSAEASLYLGSNDIVRTDLQGLARLGQFDLGVDYNTFKTDGWRTHSAAKRESGTFKLGWSTPGTKVSFAANRFNQPLAEDPLGLNSAEYAANPRQSIANATTQNTGKVVDQNQFSLRLEQDLGKWARLDARLYTGTRDLDNPLATQWITLDRSFKGLGLALSGKASLGDMPWTWAVGYDRDRMTELRRAYTNTAGVRGAAFNRNEDNAAANADVFAQSTLYVTERLGLTLGARKSSVQLTSNDYFLADGSNGTGQITYGATNPVLGAVWSVADTVNVYANWGKGFETPTLSEVAYRQVGTTVVGEFNPGLAAANSKHSEVGAKWQVSKTTRVDAALFSIRTAGELVPQRTSSGQSVFQNAGATSRKGLELSARSQFSEQWSALAAYTYTDAEFASAYSRVIGTATTTIAKGNSLPAVPRQLLNASLTFKPVRSTRLSAEWGASSRLWANDTNTAHAAGYGVLNLAASHTLELGKMSLGFFGRLDNVTGKKYAGSVIVNEAAQRFFEPGLGRTWLVGVNLKGSF
jgi:iron complex outermembrane recepter protein